MIVIQLTSDAAYTMLRIESITQSDTPATDENLRDIVDALKQTPYVLDAHGLNEISVSITVPVPDRSVSYP